jgi:hypothetical protein
MSLMIQFQEGWYNIKGQPTSVAGHVFPLVEDYREDDKGYYVTVDARNVRGFPDRNIRIRVPHTEAYHVNDGSAVTPHTETAHHTSHETDDEIKDRLRKRFKMLSDITQAAKEGNVRAVIVSGPPGVGKSFGVEAQLAKADLFNTMANRKAKFEIVKGAMSALGLYAKLYEYSEAGNVIVFDDCDSVLLDDLSLNILKAALDSSKRRWISWNTDSRLLRNEGIPSRFEFKASAIFITNIKFDHVKSKKLKDHLDALESRCHYVDLTIDSERDKVLRIKQIVEDGMLRDYNFEPDEVDEIMEFVESNKKQLRELSLRTVLKLADLKKSFKDAWQDYAVVTCMK